MQNHMQQIAVHTLFTVTERTRKIKYGKNFTLDLIKPSVAVAAIYLAKNQKVE